MAPTDQVVPAQHASTPSRRVVNDFSIQVATVNGSGSQTANLVLLRSIFQMGVPVSGKNLFPSNIAGLPTWYTIRANHRGYISRKKEIDFLVAMNPETAREDVMSLEPGRAVVFDAPLKLDALRSDLVFYPVPFDKIVAEVCTDAKLRRLVKNMIYDGVLSHLLSIELDEMKKALTKQMGRKPKALQLNVAALEAGRTYAAEHLEKRDPYRIDRMDKTSGQILIEGNAVPTTVTSRTELRAMIPASVLAEAGKHAITVENPLPVRSPQWGNTSNTAYLLVPFEFTTAHSQNRW